MLEGLSLGSYLLLVGYTGRLFRTGKAVIVGSSQFSVVSSQRATSSRERLEHSSVGSSQLSVLSCQSSLLSGRHHPASGWSILQWAVLSCQFSVVSRHFSAGDIITRAAGAFFSCRLSVVSSQRATSLRGCDFRRAGKHLRSTWQHCGSLVVALEKLSQGRLLGRYFAAKRKRLREVARDLGVHHLAKLGGWPAR